jgi:hypothetical protein
MHRRRHYIASTSKGCSEQESRWNAVVASVWLLDRVPRVVVGVVKMGVSRIVFSLEAAGEEECS